MTATQCWDWAAANQAYLAEALAALRAHLERQQRNRGERPDAAPASGRAPVPPDCALGRIAEQFALTPFERDLLLLCAGIELDGEFAELCRAMAGGEPTFGFALAALPEAHWSALAPTRPLRYWQLIELRVADALTRSPLRVDERVLHYLAGVSHLDERLHGIVQQAPPVGRLAAAHCEIAERIAAVWSRALVRQRPLPPVQIVGPEDAGGGAIAAAACAAHGTAMCVMQAADLPTSPAERAKFERLWSREAALGGCGLLVVVSGGDGPETLRGVVAFALRARSPVLITCQEPLPSAGRPIVRFDIGKPSRAEQAALWRSALGAAVDGAAHMTADTGLDDCVEALADQFDLGPAAIAATSDIVLSEHVPPEGAMRPERLWEACRAQARARLDDLAQRIVTESEWDDLVLPAEQKEALREIVACIRQRGKVYHQWGFAAKNRRGLGVSALFSGASGTGKTLAAEIVANELRLDLYRIDLSQIVSKYIGETEKNLNRVFAAAESGGAVLLFDEADALFGKRSDVKDSHDRYANMEVSYLLQRMESYRGVAILTTNLQQALDPAFRRRIRFVVQFPFPDEAERAEIWRRAFPPAAPLDGLDVGRLARLNITGGNIRNIALGAAFLAAESGSGLSMAHLLRTARAEYAKIGRPLTEAELGGWSLT